jgi:hypothetical protein
MAESKPYDYPISAHGHGRMCEPKPVRISLISAHGHVRMGEPKPV